MYFLSSGVKGLNEKEIRPFFQLCIAGILVENPSPNQKKTGQKVST